MNLEQKEALRRHRINITDDLEPEEVLDYLNQDGVLTENDCELVSSGKTRKERCQLLLSLLLRRGPGAYGSFRHALSETRYGHIADLLVLPQVSDPAKDTTFMKDHNDNTKAEEMTCNNSAISRITVNPERLFCEKCQQILQDIPQNTSLTQILSQHCCLILDNVEPMDMIDHHYQDGVLSDDECERIRAGITRSDRCKTLFMELAKHRSEHVVPTFQKSLAKKYKFILDQINLSHNLEPINRLSVMEEMGRTENAVTHGACSSQKSVFPLMHGPVVQTNSVTFGDAMAIRTISPCEHQCSCNGCEICLKRKLENRNANPEDGIPKDGVHGSYSAVSLVKSVESVQHKLLTHKRFTVVYNYLSTLINQGSFHEFETVCSNLHHRHLRDPDMNCLLAYLHASKDLFKNELDAAKQHIDKAFGLVCKTTDPTYVTVELFTAQTRMYIKQKKLGKLENALEDVKQIIESDPYGCTGRAAGWLYMNDGRSKTAQMTTLNQRSPNYLSVHNHLSAVARESFHRALVNFQRDGGNDGPFGCGYALCQLAKLLLKCGDNGLTMNAIFPSADDIKTAGDYLRKLEDSHIPIPNILEVQYRLAKCDYQFRRNNTVRALEYAKSALELATQINMPEFAEYAQKRISVLKSGTPRLEVEEITEEKALQILLSESSGIDCEDEEV